MFEALSGNAVTAVNESCNHRYSNGGYKYFVANHYRQ
jgi:hypothetical protein